LWATSIATALCIEQIESALNNRPRKSLGWHTPSDIMAGFYTVALAA